MRRAAEHPTAGVFAALLAALATSLGLPLEGAVAAGSRHAASVRHARHCAARGRTRHARARRAGRCHRRHPAPRAHTSPNSPTGALGSSPGSPLTANAPGAPSAPPGSTEPPSGTPPPSVPHVQVTAVEFSFTLSRTTVPAGKVILQFVNNGQDEHNLNAALGEEPSSFAVPNTASRTVRTLQVELRPGAYTLFCSLPEHERKGMKATLLVQ